MREFTVQSEPLMQHARKLWAVRGEGKTFPTAAILPAMGDPEGPSPTSAPHPPLRKICRSTEIYSFSGCFFLQYRM